MALRVSKINGKYSVSAPGAGHVLGVSKATATRQTRLLRAIDHGWHPSKAEEHINRQAREVAQQLLEVDDLASLPIPATGKAYARLRGMRGLRQKQELYRRMTRDLANPGQSLKGFPSRDATEESAPVTDRLERGRVEPVTLVKGKTRGKFRFPGNFKVRHAMK